MTKIPKFFQAFAISSGLLSSSLVYADKLRDNMQDAQKYQMKAQHHKQQAEMARRSGHTQLAQEHDREA